MTKRKNKKRITFHQAMLLSFIIFIIGVSLISYVYSNARPLNPRISDTTFFIVGNILVVVSLLMAMVFFMAKIKL